VQNEAAFAAALVVQKNATNPNRVDVLWPGILIDRLDVFALLAQFRLQ
jgi:phage tail sheath gpL-like